MDNNTMGNNTNLAINNTREITIKFSVMGTCCQTIKIDNKCELTDREIIEGLEAGRLLTGVESGKLYKISDVNKFDVIGTVVDSDMGCGYRDFENVSP